MDEEELRMLKKISMMEEYVRILSILDAKDMKKEAEYQLRVLGARLELYGIEPEILHRH